jgi:hypothetical protein
MVELDPPRLPAEKETPMSHQRSLSKVSLLAAGLVFGAALPAHAAVRCVNSTDPRCTASSPTIQAAVTAVGPGDIIIVGPGTYNESVSIPAGKNGISLFGAKAGVDPRTTPVGPASVVDGTGTGSSTIIVQATDVLINGFTVQGGTGGNATGIDLKGSGGGLPSFSPAHGARIVNNIIRNNSVGLSLNSEGFGPVTGVVIEHNLFTDNNAGVQAAAGDGIFTSACQDVSINENKFTLHQRLAIGINNSSGVTITANESLSDARFVVFTGTTDSEFSHNRGQGLLASTFFSTARAAAILVGYANDHLTISENDIEGGQAGSMLRGIQFGGYGPAPANTNLTVSYNRILGMPLHGMVAEPDLLTNSIVLGNQSTDNGSEGILVNAGSSSNLLVRNVAVGNGVFDCHDLSTGSSTLGTANLWFGNLGAKASPAGLCAPPPAGDFTGDGQPDILWRNQSTGNNLLWLMNGAAFASSAPVMAISDVTWQIVGTADFNGDGHSDILWRNAASGDNVVWFMDGTNLTSGTVLTAVPDTTWRIVATGDFNGDSKADILWRNSASGDNIVWFMNGTTLTGGAVLTPIPDQSWVVGGVGDFNKDAKVDILWRNQVSGDNLVWFLDGTTLTGGAMLMPIADVNWVVGGVGDFNGDGQADIVWRNQATGDNLIWLMNGTSLAGGSTLPAMTDTNWRIVGPR